MRTLWQDLRYGARAMRKSPGFTFAALTTLALGIGANTAIFSVIHAVVLSPLPFAAPERLVGLRETLPDEGSIPLAQRTFAAWSEDSAVFESVAAMYSTEVNLEGDEPQRVTAAKVTPSYFDVMGARPALGRAFLPEDARPDSEPVVVLSHELWQSRFGGEASAVGRQARIDGSSRTIVGVMPPALADADIGWTSLWTPLRFSERGLNNPYRYVNASARLKPGVSVAQARAELERVMAALRRDFPQTHGKPYGVDVRPLGDFVVGAGTRTALYVLAGAVVFVLLIACANVANLLLARASSREREMAVRAALGASRARIVRQLLVESLFLSVLGAGLGLLLAAWGVDALAAINADAVPRFADVQINTPVLLFALGLSVLTALVFGLAPALRATKFDVNAALKGGARGGVTAGGRRDRLLGALVVSEVALSLILLVGAGLLIQSFLRLRAVEPGFDLDRVLTMEVSLPFATYGEPHQRTDFYRRTLERIRGLPGVESAGATQSLPFRPTMLTDHVVIEGRPVPPAGQEPFIRGTSVTSDYFRTMGMRLVSGRALTEQETWEGGAIVVNESFARRFFAGQDPLGQRVRVGYDRAWLTVVGVVRDVTQNGVDKQTIEEMFVPYANGANPSVVRMNLVVRAAGDPAALAGAVREEIRRSDPALPVSNVATMRALADSALSPARFNLLLLTLFAALALALALIGIYGVMSYAVTQRTHEMGIRLALGARAADVMRLVIARGMLLALAGVTLGLAGALAVTRVMSSLLYRVSATDPLTYAGLALSLALAALLACYVPARRAAHVDPVVALRYE
jgi:predicted permease